MIRIHGQLCLPGPTNRPVLRMLPAQVSTHADVDLAYLATVVVNSAQGHVARSGIWSIYDDIHRYHTDYLRIHTECTTISLKDLNVPSRPPIHGVASPKDDGHSASKQHR